MVALGGDVNGVLRQFAMFDQSVWCIYRDTFYEKRLVLHFFPLSSSYDDYSKGSMHHMYWDMG